MIYTSLVSVRYRNYVSIYFCCPLPFLVLLLLHILDLCMLQNTIIQSYNDYFYIILCLKEAEVYSPMGEKVYIYKVCHTKLIYHFWFSSFLRIQVTI